MNTNINTNKLLRAAECNEMNKHFGEAITLYETAIAYNRTSLSAYYNLAALYEKIEDTSKAKDTYKKGISTARELKNKAIELELSYSLMGLID